jgi:serine/threonine-protein kinase
VKDVAFHPSAGRRALLFGPFRFDLTDKTLSREGTEIRLPPRALAILDYLLERPHRIVAKQELIDAVWKDAFVGESSLTEAIGVLRQALGDTASGAEYIQTVHRRGYRFIAPVRLDAPAPAAVFPPLAVVPGATSVAEPAIAAPASSPPRHLAAAVVLALALVAAAAAAVWISMRPGPAPVLTRTTITLPASQAPAPGLTAQPVAALSPDGRRIVYVAGAPGSYRLFLRAIDQFEAIPLPGTDGGHAPFFSPDGNAIGFFVGRRLMVMSLPDGQPLDLAEGGAGDGGWWHTDGTIVFATGYAEGVYRIAATGGERVPLRIEGVDGADLRHPTLINDGRTLLATEWKLDVRHSEIVAVDLATGRARRVARGVHPRALPDGRIVYLRDGDLVAAPLSGDGPEVSLISGVMTGVTGAGQYALSASGTLLYLPESPSRLQRRMVRVGLDGRTAPLLFEPRAFQNLAVSPDGRRVAATIYERGASDLWVGDIERGVVQRLTSEGGSVDPVWSRDGAFVYFASTRTGVASLYRVAADGTSDPVLVSSVTSIAPASVTREGVVFAMRLEPGGGADILAIAPDGTAREWLATTANESGARVSPDDRFVAYHSNRNGRLDVYVRPIDGRGAERQVSLASGVRPEWMADSRGLVFTGPRRSMHFAEIIDGVPGRPREIFTNPGLVLTRPGLGALVGLEAIEEERPLTTLNLVVGWTRELAFAR